MKTICLDDVFNQDELFWLYKNLLITSGWRFHITPEQSVDPNKMFANIGNLNIDATSNLYSYFIGLLFRINKKLLEEKNTKINENISRIYINATNPMSKHWLHYDSMSEGAISILMMFSPQWQDSWLGSFFTDGQEYKMKPGRIIIFDSKEYHTGSNPHESCPYVRLTCNILLKK